MLAAFFGMATLSPFEVAFTAGLQPVAVVNFSSGASRGRPGGKGFVAASLKQGSVFTTTSTFFNTWQKKIQRWTLIDNDLTEKNNKLKYCDDKDILCYKLGYSAYNVCMKTRKLLGTIPANACFWLGALLRRRRGYWKQTDIKLATFVT